MGLAETTKLTLLGILDTFQPKSLEVNSCIH